MKSKVEGMEFDEFQHLLPVIPEILTEATVETLNQIFEEWMRRLQQWINANGGPVKWDLI
jgi:hypothetical protein